MLRKCALSLSAMHNSSVASSLKDACSRVKDAAEKAGRHKPVATSWFPQQLHLDALLEWLSTKVYCWIQLCAASASCCEQDKASGNAQRSLWCWAESFWRELRTGNFLPFTVHGHKCKDRGSYQPLLSHLSHTQRSGGCAYPRIYKSSVMWSQHMDNAVESCSFWVAGISLPVHDVCRRSWKRRRNCQMTFHGTSLVTCRAIKPRV